MDTLNEEQLEAYEALCDGDNIFLTGPGGTGKSYFIGAVVKAFTMRDKRVAVTAMTGCAAVLLSESCNVRARTIHSWAGVGLGRETVQELTYKINRNGRAKKNWMTTDLLIIDEISMMTPTLLEKLNEIGKKVRRNPTKPFGGIQLLFVGDFFQLPPVITKQEAQAQPNVFAFQSDEWVECVPHTVELRQIIRQKDPIFQDLLTASRYGKLSTEHCEQLRARIGLPWQRNKIKPTLLFSRRFEVDKINQANLAALKGEVHTYQPDIVFNGEKPAGLGKDNPDMVAAVARMDTDSSYVSDLVLAEGAQVMLITNLDQDSHLVNGSRGVIVGFGEAPKFYPKVQFLSGQVMEIKEHGWEIDGFEKFAKRTQIPLRLAWAVTIHKSQGSTLDCALIDIGQTTFEYGQAYVALSRVRDINALYIHDFDVKAVRAHPLVLKRYLPAATEA
jgi:ATP-dependent DNA helicase PIF1